VQALNLGYDGADGGAESTVVPSLLAPHTQQNVSAIQNLNLVARGLRALAACENAELAELDVSGFAVLQRLEAYRHNLTALGTSGCSALRRICVETFGRSRLIGGPLDLADSPIEDIRGSGNGFTTIYWPSGTLTGLWHLCVRNNPLDAAAIPAFSRMPDLLELFIEGTQRTAVLDCRGYLQTPGSALWVNDNDLDDLLIDGCALWFLRARNCGLSQSEVNSILVEVESWGTSNGQIDLTLNAAPSGAGATAAAALLGRGWAVQTETTP
jgi:hypothetical protein